MVNTQGISGSNDAWMQFVNLTREARKRQGIESTETKRPINQNASIKINVSNYAQNLSTVKKIENNNGEHKVKTRILGGLIDTYA